MNNQVESLRYRVVEPLVLGDLSVWGRVAEASAAALGCSSAALVVAISQGFHVVLGHTGICEELTTCGGLGGDFSPASAVLARQERVLLDEQGAKLWGLGGWQQAARCRGVLAAPLHAEGQVVGALVLGFEQSALPRPWQIEGALRLSQDASALLAHRSKERLRSRTSGLTIVEPGVARAALRALVRRMTQPALRLAAVEERVWSGLTRLSQRDLAACAPEAAALLREVVACHEQLSARLEMLDERGDIAGSNLGHELMLSLLQELLPARALVALAQRFSSGKMTREQTMFGLRLLGRRRPPRLASVARELSSWGEARAAMIFCSPRGEGSPELEQGEAFFRRSAPALRGALGKA